ncbi:STAS domain protein, partial [Chlamydia psittaci 84-8471/1]
SSH